ncbi:hypothetical protein GPECTOR_15g372 [Gonium pectorale]|uniref:Protein kinase domain-containing protein n=1 Tax=Gonium pectorale TaxID=33097 RepID=A0A150GLN2_GONPE|nr:hypothetical protein GPECTOR_15g372 [Gonium pectorale]|eukprot:KXZ50688.1 hypothetical protein GPECTOR_15g372 [Gonium pectorale]
MPSHEPPVAPSQPPRMAPSIMELVAGVTDMAMLAQASSSGSVWLGGSRLHRFIKQLQQAHGSAPAGPVGLAGPAGPVPASWARAVTAAAGTAPVGATAAAAAGGPSLTVYPGDIMPLPPPPTPAHRVLGALQLQPWDVVVASITDYYPLGNVLSLASGPGSPFLPAPGWPLRAAARSLICVATEVASALAELHAAGIAHGALSPANVLLAPADRNYQTGLEVEPQHDITVRVCDVGSPWAVQQATSGAGVATAAQGERQVLPPEVVAHGSAALLSTPAADVFCYGALLFLLATGGMPGEAEQGAGALSQGAAPPTDPRLEWPAGPHGYLGPLFRACTARRPEDRPSIQQVLERLTDLTAEFQA